MADSLKNSHQETNYDEDNGETNITPSVIRRGLCIFPMEGESFKTSLTSLKNKKNDIMSKARGTSESVIKYGEEIATACDPLAAAIAIGGKIGVGLSLSRFSASQCAGIVGLIISSINPQASVPLLLKKIGEDLDCLKKSLDVIRENPHYLAQEYLSIALNKLDDYKFQEAIKNFQKAEYQALKGMNMAPTFQGLLGCLQIKIFSGVMLECASDLESIPCFLPIHLLPASDKQSVEKIIKSGLSTIMKKAETTTWNGKKKISLKTQNILDPFLASLYNTYSIAASFTDPYQDCTLPMPETIRFKINLDFIPEGEMDCCKLELLLVGNTEIVLFLWKEFKKYGTFLLIRHRKTTWSMNATYGNLFELNYDIKRNKMMTATTELERLVCWPKERMDIMDMIEEAKQKVNGNIKSLNSRTYKWIRKVPMQYLQAMEVDLEYRTSEGNTLLHILADENESDNMNCLLEKMKEIDPTDKHGQTPLIRACKSGSFQAAKILIAYGANVNAVNHKKDSPLTILASRKVIDIHLLKMLVGQNADREHENEDLMRPLDLAHHNNFKSEIVKLLRPS